jgi:hypothetical protein
VVRVLLGLRLSDAVASDVKSGGDHPLAPFDHAVTISLALPCCPGVGMLEGGLQGLAEGLVPLPCMCHAEQREYRSRKAKRKEKKARKAAGQDEVSAAFKARA